MLLAGLTLVACTHRSKPVTPALTPLVDVQSLVPDLHVDMRYFGTNNFVGTRIDGYEANKCLLQAPVANALAAVERRLRAESKRLLIFDCYRPKRAVAHFMRWARDLDDQATKPAYYPNLDKSVLVPDYIAEQSGHSRADTVDLAIMTCQSVDDINTCTMLDFGTPFDFFDPLANTDSDKVSAQSRTNRQALVDAMAAAGFRNYPLEWWHFTLNDPEHPGPARDEPVQ
ncbi:hypothetical protein C7S18_11530 [Ahniella affigens]|uniref:D-alanyl-D-alanine dipeptidase n=2 Tax=Ahniella affigens TaxID=2021234 RepID=A0A2P1PZ21_9GAMM|nr:hypothetical protein C7S18_11530 [Ahniella affigens]